MNAKIVRDSLKRFDPEIRQMEKDIVTFFKEKGAEFGGKDPIFMTILAYFYIREKLTQQDLRDLTGFSAGTVSKVIRQLVQFNLITKGTIPGTHKHLYTMEQLPVAFSQFYLPASRILSKSENELKQMKGELIGHAQEMQNIKGFNEVLAAVTLLLQSVPLALAIFAEIINEAEKHTKK